VIKLSDNLDDNYHVAILDPKSRKPLGKEEQFQTLEEVLGFLHKVEESERIRDRLFVCLMGLRDGVSEVTIHRKEFLVGNQILMVKPPERFHKLFWGGFGLESKK
jgi:hypothetical protein